MEKIVFGDSRNSPQEMSADVEEWVDAGLRDGYPGSTNHSLLDTASVGEAACSVLFGVFSTEFWI